MPRSQKPKRPAIPEISAFRESLWRTLERNARGLSGADVIDALKCISDQVYDAGIDAAYTETEFRNPANVADAWDLTWVTALSIHLRERQARHIRGRKTR